MSFMLCGGRRPRGKRDIWEGGNKMTRRARERERKEVASVLWDVLSGKGKRQKLRRWNCMQGPPLFRQCCSSPPA